MMHLAVVDRIQGLLSVLIFFAGIYGMIYILQNPVMINIP